MGISAGTSGCDRIRLTSLVTLSARFFIVRNEMNFALSDPHSLPRFSTRMHQPWPSAGSWITGFNLSFDRITSRVNLAIFFLQCVGFAHIVYLKSNVFFLL